MTLFPVPLRPRMQSDTLALIEKDMLRKTCFGPKALDTFSKTTASLWVALTGHYPETEEDEFDENDVRKND